MESLKISVDLKRRTNEVLSLQQGYTYPVELSIFDNGIAYTCTGAAAQVHFLKSTGKFSIKTTDITISGNKVSFKLDNTLINRGGVGQLQIVLTKGGDVFGSWAIHCNVFANVIQDESTEDSNIIDVLGDLTKNIAKADPLSKALEKQIPQATPLTNSLKTQIPQATELVNEMKSAIEEGGTVDKRELGEFKKGYTGKEYDNLDHRINGDIDHVQQQINDSSLLPYEGTNIKADNTYYGLTKDVVIKGRTLQNLVPTKIYNDRTCYGSLSPDAKLNGTTLSCVASGGYRNLFVNLKEFNLIKQNTDYTIILTIHKNTLEGEGNLFTFSNKEQTAQAFDETITTKDNGLNVGMYKFVGRLKNDISDCSYLFRTSVNSGATSGEIEFSYYILEGDHTNTPIEELPFIEGIKSTGENEKTEDGRCKISGKSCGKNLLPKNYTDKSFREGIIENKRISTEMILTPRGKEVTVYGLLPDIYKTTYVEYSNSKLVFGETDSNVVRELIKDYSVATQVTFTTRTDFKYMSIYSYSSEHPEDYKNKAEIGLCLGSDVPTSYEPYQESTYSYILDEPLRQLPNGVADSINLETGVLTRRVGEVVLNGSENWRYSSTSDSYFKCAITLSDLTNAKISQDFICDKFKKIDVSNDALPVEEGICRPQGNIVISILKTKLTTQDVAGFKTWLSQNPTTVYYELAEPTTEQLTPTQLKSFEGTTHIVSNNTLQAHISVKIPSNVNLVIQNLRAENKALNVELKDAKEELINTDLDILEMNWETDFRVCELEYAIYGQVAKTTELENNIRAISKYEQAKTLILADRYNKATMTKQLEVYFDRGYISEKEYQELIELMN